MSETEQKRPGRPKHEPTERNRNVITKLLRYGLPQRTISNIMCMGIDTLRGYYSDLLDSVTQDRKVEILDTAYAKAIEERNVPLLIFLCKTVVGLQENPAAETILPESISEITVKILEPKKDKEVKK